MAISEEMHVAEMEDLKTGMVFTICFECFTDFVDYIRVYNRPLDVKWIEPAYSFGFDPIYERRKRDVKNCCDC